MPPVRKPIDIHPREGNRRSLRQDVFPFARLTWCAEQEPAAGSQGTSYAISDFVLIIGRQEQEPDRDCSIERSLEQAAGFRCLADYLSGREAAAEFRHTTISLAVSPKRHRKTGAENPAEVRPV